MPFSLLRLIPLDQPLHLARHLKGISEFSDLPVQTNHMVFFGLIPSSFDANTPLTSLHVIDFLKKHRVVLLYEVLCKPGLITHHLLKKIQSGSMVLHFKIGGERPTLRSQTLPNEKRRFTQGQGIALQGIAVISPLQPELFLHCLDGFGFNRAVNIKPSLQSFYLCEIRHGNIHPANYNWLFTIFLAFPPHRAHAEEPFPSAPA